MITIKFSRLVFFTEGLGPNGVAITHSGGGTYQLLLSGATGSGDDTVQYEGSWDIPINVGDTVTWTYTNASGDYRDSNGEQLVDTVLNMTNCLDSFPVPIYGDRVDCSVTPVEPHADGCYLKVATFTDPAVTPIVINCNGLEYNTDGTGDVLISTSTFGHAYVAEINVTGLSGNPLEHVAWDVTQGAYTDSGYLNRLPAAGEEHMAILYSCDNNTNLSNKESSAPYAVIALWPEVKALLDASIAGTGTFVSMIVGIDDYSGYIDSKVIDDTYDANSSGLTATLSLQNGGSENDVSLAWMSYLGATGTTTPVVSSDFDTNNKLSCHWGREPNRAFCRKVSPRKMLHGDHECSSVPGDFGYATDATAGGNVWWDTYPTVKGRAQLAIEAFIDTAGLTKCLDGDGGQRDAYSRNWVLKAGNIRMFCLDHLAHGTGDAGSGASTYLATPQMVQVYSDDQIDDIKDELMSEDYKFNIFTLGSGLIWMSEPPPGGGRLAQNPLYNLCKHEFERLFTDSTTGLAGYDNSNGTTGHLIAVSGDLHRRTQITFNNDAYTGNDAIDLDHWHTGAMSSLNFDNGTGIVEGGTFDSTSETNVHGTLHSDEQIDVNYHKAFSFIIVQDLPGEATPTMRVQSIDNDGLVAYQKDYLMAGGSETFNLLDSDNGDFLIDSTTSDNLVES